jgi:hypothetical protein
MDKRNGSPGPECHAAYIEEVLDMKPWPGSTKQI